MADWHFRLMQLHMPLEISQRLVNAQNAGACIALGRPYHGKLIRRLVPIIELLKDSQ